MLWFVLAALWAAIALTGALHHRGATAALEAAFALLFAAIGLAVRRRDRGIAARYTARRPR
jgi:membrane-bound metal-dependent hydrolase YbcI (DUF457 family)